MSAAALRDPLTLGAPLTFGPGRRAKPLNMAFDRELSVEDILAAQTSTLVQKLPPIQKIRQRHHTVARLLAQGLSNVEAARVTGMDPQYIGNIKDDPAFAELLAYYTSMEAEQYAATRADLHHRLAELGFDTIEELHSRLEEKPETITVKELVAIAELTADRTGYGKTSTTKHEHEFSISAETLERVKANALSARPVIAKEDREALVRLAAGRTAALLSDPEEPAWIEGEGNLVREEGDPASEE